MKFEEIWDSLPNGLHDASMKSIVLDYVKREATFLLELWVAELIKEGDSEIYQDAKLTLKGLLYCVIEPPRGGALYKDRASVIAI